MTLVRYEPWTLMNRLHRELDELFRDPPAATTAPTGSRSPPGRAAAERRRARGRGPLPGARGSAGRAARGHPGHCRSGRADDPCGARAERREGAPVNGRYERFAGTFVRRFTLPEDANAEAIGARSTHGVLELTRSETGEAGAAAHRGRSGLS